MAEPERLRSDEVIVVLVHGACHGAWCWEDVIGPLAKRGWKARALELPLTSLTDDALVVRDAVHSAKLAGKAALLVGHSYGGVVISEGGHEADHLVYVAGTAPDPGESAMDLMSVMVATQQSPGFVVSDDGMQGRIDPDGASATFYNRCHRDQVAAAIPRLRPMMLRCLEQSVGRPAWMDVPASYVVCTDDRAMALAYQRERAELLRDSVVLEADHSPFYSATGQLVEWLDAMARRVVDHLPDAGPTTSRRPLQ